MIGHIMETPSSTGEIVLYKGDMFTSQARAISQGVNVYGSMGAGIAKTFSDRFPSMYLQYRLKCHSGLLTPGEVDVYQLPDPYPGYFIYNIASQDAPGPNARLEWIESGTREALRHAADHGLDRIAMPWIGCGIGGLHRSDVFGVLSRVVREGAVGIEIWSLI